MWRRGLPMGRRDDQDLSAYQEWAEDGYDHGMVEEGHESYGELAALGRAVRDNGGLVAATSELEDAGFDQLLEDAAAALRRFDRADLASLLGSAVAAFRELAPGEDPSPAQERAHRELDDRWVDEGGDQFIDDLGRRLMADSDWSPR